MNEAQKILTRFSAVPENRVRFSTRLLIYVAMWLFAALVFQAFLQPAGLSETELTPIQQRLLWPLYTPVMAVVGLAQAGTWPVFPSALAILAGGACFAVHGIIALSRKQWSSIVALAGVHALLLAIAVIYFVRQAQLPTGG